MKNENEETRDRSVKKKKFIIFELGANYAKQQLT